MALVAIAGLVFFTGVSFSTWKATSQDRNDASVSIDQRSQSTRTHAASAASPPHAHCCVGGLAGESGGASGGGDGGVAVAVAVETAVKSGIRQCTCQLPVADE